MWTLYSHEMKTEQMCELNPRQMLPGSRSMKSNEYFIKNCSSFSHKFGQKTW